MVGRLGLGRGHHGAAGVTHLDERRPVRRRARADRILARRVDVLQVLVVDELGRAPAGHAEIERTPGDERGLVGDGREVDVRLGVKLGHSGVPSREAAERFMRTLAAGTNSMANAGSALAANRLPVDAAPRDGCRPNVSAAQTSA